MVVTQRRSRRKATGGRFKAGARSKKQYESGNKPTLPKIGEKQSKTVRTIGGNNKLRVMIQV